MKDHSHPEPKKCAHDLGWCEKCERPYCKTCGQEWYAQTNSALMEAFRQRDGDAYKGISSWPSRPIPYQNPQWLGTPVGPDVRRLEVLCTSHGTQKG